jgi:hypothetical protein
VPRSPKVIEETVMRFVLDNVGVAQSRRSIDRRRISALSSSSGVGGGLGLLLLSLLPSEATG